MLVRVGGLIVALSIVGAANAAAPASPCKLVTTAQVKAAFGGTVGSGKLDNTVPGAPTCHFAVKHSNLGISGDAIVFITPGQSAATFKLAKKYVPGAVTVHGVATAAFYNPHTTSIELLKGNVVASAQGVFYNASGPQANAAKIKADVIVLAKAVAKHL
jgi:type IV secretory pathway protease TraF